MASHALSEGRAIKPQEQVTKPFEKPDEGKDVVMMIWSPWIDIAASWQAYGESSSPLIPSPTTRK